MSYLCKKPGVVEISGEDFTLVPGEDVTKIASALAEPVVQSLLDDGKIISNTKEHENAIKAKAKAEDRLEKAKAKAKKVGKK